MLYKFYFKYLQFGDMIFEFKANMFVEIYRDRNRKIILKNKYIYIYKREILYKIISGKLALNCPFLRIYLSISSDYDSIDFKRSHNF